MKAIKALFLSAFLLLFILIAAVIGILIYADFSPLMVDKVVLSDGERHVVFDGMSHIATREFYQAIRQDIADEKQNGATYYFEAIVPSKNEAINRSIEQDLTGNKNENVHLHDILSVVSEAGDLEIQPQNQFIGLVNSNDVNVDMSAENLVAEINKANLGKTINLDSDASRLSSDDLSKTIDALREIPRQQRESISWLTRMILRLGFKFSGGINASDPRSAYLLDKRNEILANAILHGPNRIIVTYGNQHFDGVLKLLLEKDSHWHIEARSKRIAF